MDLLDHSIDWTKLPGISMTFKFENAPDIDKRLKFLGDNMKLWYLVSGLYVLVVFYLKNEMKSRKAYNLQTLLATWNFLLSAFSLIVSIRLVPELISTFSENGFVGTICDSSGLHKDPRVKYWIYIFVLSKVLEFGDTLFVVLKRRDLIFLHWYHHAVTFLYSFYSVGVYLPAYTRWFIIVNAIIHTVMYGYYGARTLGYRFSRLVNMSITTSQIAQMVFGLSVNLLALYHRKKDSSCDAHPMISVVGILIYSSFLILFVNFFVRTYLAPCRSPSSRKLKNQ